MMVSNSLLDEIRGVHEKRESGILTLSKNDDRVDVFYREGMIQAASSNLESHRLGDYLVRGGYLTVRDLRVVLANAKKYQVLFGEAAVRRKLLDTPELAAIVRRQAIELVQHVLDNGFSKTSFTASLRSFYTPANINFAYLRLELCRSNSTPFESDPNRLLVLSTENDLSELDWYPEELSVLSGLTSPNSVTGLLASSGVNEASLRKILGVFNGLGIIELLQSSETESTRAEQETAAIKRSSFPFDGLIPVVRNAVVSEKLEVLNNASSFISEQFKNLKVRIAEAREIPPKVFTVSSPEPQDGKSLVSSNLALSFSMEPGRRVIIVDCDLRNPTLGRYLGVGNEQGLLQYLSNGRLAPHCYVRRVENLFFLTSGGIAQNPIELLSLQRMKHFVEYLKRDFDTIILDAPPFSPVADARIVTALSDGFIMVIRRGKTPYRSIEGAFKVMDQQKLLGVVFNDVKPMLFNTYYHRGYYTYGHDSGYLSSNSRKSRTSPKKYLES